MLLPFQQRARDDFGDGRLHQPAPARGRGIEGTIAFDEFGPFGGPAIGYDALGQATSRRRLAACPKYRNSRAGSQSPCRLWTPVSQ
jgi:hypothetical protein